MLATPRRETIVSVPLRRYDGSLEVLTGFRVQHNYSRGPTKGGIRYHLVVELDEVRALAMWMAWKCTLLDIPYRGAKGGIASDLRRYSLGERERITGRYSSEPMPILCPGKDIPAPDIGSDEQTMAWMMDTYSVSTGHAIQGVATGKPRSIGGSRGRIIAIAQGVVHCVKVTVESTHRTPRSASVAVQGVGSGLHVGRLPTRTSNQEYLRRGRRVSRPTRTHTAQRRTRAGRVAQVHQKRGL